MNLKCFNCLYYVDDWLLTLFLLLPAGFDVQSILESIKSLIKFTAKELSPFCAGGDNSMYISYRLQYIPFVLMYTMLPLPVFV